MHPHRAAPLICNSGLTETYMGFTELLDAPGVKWLSRERTSRLFNEGYAMLVLTRRAGESIMIDNDIELKVLKIRGSQVHLGIEAPKRAAVHRKEVWLRIQDEQADPEPPQISHATNE